MDISKLSDSELLRRTEELAADLRKQTVELVESLVELDARKLYIEKNRSLFEYCVFQLKMSDGAAYRRIRAARAFQAYPPVKALLRSGELSLESLVLLHPFLNDADAGALVTQAAGKGVREIEKLVAPRRTEPPRRDTVRFIPAPTPAPALPAAAAPPSLFELPAIAAETAPPAPNEAPPESHAPRTEAPARVKPAPLVHIAFTADESFHRLLRETQAAMRHKYPDGRLDGIFRDALMLLLRKKTPYAFRAAKR